MLSSNMHHIWCIRIYPYNNKNVDIKLSAHDTFLEQPSSGTLKIEKLENQIIKKIFGSNKTKESKQDSQNLLKSPMPEGGEP